MINVRDKFFIIRELSCKYTLKLLYNIASVSRSGYYKWLNKGNKGKKDISYSELENKILEKCATDITYLFYGDYKKKSYLSAIKDLFNNEIVAYKVSKHLDLSFVLETVNIAVKRNKNSINGLILHSYQGIHYTSKTYQALL